MPPASSKTGLDKVADKAEVKHAVSLAVEVVLGNEVLQADLLQWFKQTSFGPHHDRQGSLIENKHRYATIVTSDFQRAVGLSTAQNRNAPVTEYLGRTIDQLHKVALRSARCLDA